MLKPEITLPIQLTMSNGKKTVTKFFMSHYPDIIKTHSRRDFIAINESTHSGATSRGNQWTTALT